MRKVREILRLRYERGYPHRTIARAVHVGAATVSEYLAKAAAKGLGWPLPEEFNDAKLEEVLFPRAPASSEREVPDFAAVHEELQRHRELTLLQLWVEYAEDNPRAYLQPLLRAVPALEEETEPDDASASSCGREDVRGLLGQEAAHRRSQDGGASACGAVRVGTRSEQLHVRGSDRGPSRSSRGPRLTRVCRRTSREAPRSGFRTT